MIDGNNTKHLTCFIDETKLKPRVQKCCFFKTMFLRQNMLLSDSVDQRSDCTFCAV